MGISFEEELQTGILCQIRLRRICSTITWLLPPPWGDLRAEDDLQLW